MQVYRGMDIGTAKPPAELRQGLPHHLIDIRDPDEQYDVGAFVHDANRAIEAILSRGRVPVVAGGTGYYFRHLLYGLPQAPPSDPDIRERVRGQLTDDGPEVLWQRLQEVDPSTAERVGPRDAYRVTRALEVYEQTGRPLSAFAMTGPARSDVRVRSFHLVRGRDELRRRIATRVAQMFAAGLRAEVEALVERGYTAGDPGMRAIGYREFFREDGSLRPPLEDPRIREAITRNTSRYAKRQATFFRRLPDVEVIDLSGLHTDDQSVAAVVDAVRSAAGELDRS